MKKIFAIISALMLLILAALPVSAADGFAANFKIRNDKTAGAFTYSAAEDKLTVSSAGTTTYSAPVEMGGNDFVWEFDWTPASVGKNKDRFLFCSPGVVGKANPHANGYELYIDGTASPGIKLNHRINQGSQVTNVLAEDSELKLEAITYHVIIDVKGDDIKIWFYDASAEKPAEPNLSATKPAENKFEGGSLVIYSYSSEFTCTNMTYSTVGAAVDTTEAVTTTEAITTTEAVTTTAATEAATTTETATTTEATATAPETGDSATAAILMLAVAVASLAVITSKRTTAA